MENKYHFFWKSRLSQWSLTRFQDEAGVTYNCCEQYMMAQKALLFDDEETYAAIMSSTGPGEQKALGRQVRGYNEAVWCALREEIVLKGNRFRAQHDPEFRALLLSTDDSTLVEASPFDRIWGIGYDRNTALANIEDWGLNLLGKALMKLRAELRH